MFRFPTFTSDLLDKTCTKPFLFVLAEFRLSVSMMWLFLYDKIYVYIVYIYVALYIYSVECTHMQFASACQIIIRVT